MLILRSSNQHPRMSLEGQKCPKRHRLLARKNNHEQWAGSCQKLTDAAQQNPYSLDHLVGGGEQRGRHGDA
jgi:hypothetical protein